MKKIVLDFEGNEKYEIPVKVQDGEFASISNVVPVDGYVVVVAHLKVTAFDVVNSKVDKTPANVKYYLGSTCPAINESKLKLNIGDRVKLPENISQGDGTLIIFSDEDNKHSPSIIKSNVTKDPLLLIAKALMKSEAKSSFGLNTRSLADINLTSLETTIDSLKYQDSGKKMQLFKDTYIDMTSYYITHISTILGKIYNTNEHIR
ncbi:MAG: hypothetical protein WC346_03930 [Methanogenium sp.]|jgi:hypothetical protein